MAPLPTQAEKDAKPEVYGKWGDLFQLPNVPIHVSLLPTGKVLYWGRRGFPKAIPKPSMDEHFTNAYIWDPDSVNTGAHSTANKPKLLASPPWNGADVNLFCSAHCLQPDGKLLVVGGHNTDGVGVEQASVYDPWTDTWTAKTPMAAGRWYPSALTLADGRALVISGSTAGYFPLRDTLIWDTNRWVKVSPPPVLSLYPRLHLSPDGRVFMAGPQAQSLFLNVNIQPVNEKGLPIQDLVGDWWAGASTAGIPDLERRQGSREYAPSVMYDSGKIMYIGGGNDRVAGNQDTRIPSKVVEFINLMKDPIWKMEEKSNMAFPRQQHNGTVLPDGTVLVTGGCQGEGWNNLSAPVRTPELWSPDTNTWTPMSDEIAIRCYHSTALLLPDGQVLSAGGGEYDPSFDETNNLTNGQLFKPPYIFKGAARPTVTKAPSTVEYGKDFSVIMGTNDSILRASWVRLGSVTHSFNFNQSLMFLTTKQNGTTVTVTPPANANQAPPGHYMLFLLTPTGLPCQKAPIIGIGPVPPVAPLTIAPAKPAPARALRTTMTRHVDLSTPELNEKIINEQTRPAVAVGLTPLCYYGLGPCWGGAHEGLHRINDIDVVRPIPSQADSVAYVYLKHDILPDIDVWRSEFSSTANGSYIMRGIEMTLSGLVTKKTVDTGEQLTLAGTDTRSKLVLESFQENHQIKWDLKAEAPKPITDEEAAAYKQLSAALEGHAAGLNMKVTGWLEKHDADKFFLHVRKFET